MIAIGNKMVVSIRFNMYDGSGQLLESRLDASPVHYLHGGDTILPSLQQQLCGLSAGDSRRVFLPESENPLGKLIFFDIVIDSVRSATSAELEAGYPLPKYGYRSSQLVIHLVSGFLGSGKTTAIYQACKLLQERGSKPSVITNDQGRLLVDTHFFSSKGIRVMQISNGCYCCNYKPLEVMIGEIAAQASVRSMVFAEAVGSCTDIVATVMKPLLSTIPQAIVTVTSFADALLLLNLIRGKQTFVDDVKYIYYKQLEEASVIVLNKIDLLHEKELKEVQQHLRSCYPGKEIIEQNSLVDNEGSPWLSWLENQKTSIWLPSLELDYDRYAAGEAKMAWLDKELIIQSASGMANIIARKLANEIAVEIMTKEMPVGHLKFWINGTHKLSFTAAGTQDPMDEQPVAALSASLVINARVQTEPEELDQIVWHAIRNIMAGKEVQVIVKHAALFKPGYPVPVQRIA